MKLTALLITIALTIPAVWGQKYPKRVAVANAPASRTLKFRSLTAHPVQARALSSKAAPAPAPGVVQVYVDPSSGVLTAYFIATVDIPGTSQITGGMTLVDDGSSIDFQQVTVSDVFGGDMQPGDYILLPAISSFGTLFQGVFDYTVEVIPSRGATLQADGIFVVGEAYEYSDLAGNEPIAGSVSQSINSGKDVILGITGYFSGDPVQVVLSDLFSSYIPPASAVTVTANQINVDMSQVTGFDLTFSDGLLVTVSEDNISSTVAFQYLPPQTGTFNPAPSQ